MVTQIDLWTLLDRDPEEAIDVGSGEAKIREAARLRTDIEIAFLRAIEAARNALTPEQRSRLTAVLAAGSSSQADPPGAGDPPTEGRAAGHPPSGGPPSHPPSGRPPAGYPHPGPPPPGHHFDHGHVIVRGGPFWWGPPYYPYWFYPGSAYYPPPVPPVPPEYIQQAPPGYWYYCESAGAYYPTVQTCPEPWVLVAPSG
jgi:hypothetical protein